MTEKYRFLVFNNSHKVKFDMSSCSLRELDKKFADFISSHGGGYRCEVEYKWRFFIVYYLDSGRLDHCRCSIQEYDELFLHDYRVGNIDI